MLPRTGLWPPEQESGLREIVLLSMTVGIVRVFTAAWGWRVEGIPSDGKGAWKVPCKEERIPRIGGG